VVDKDLKELSNILNLHLEDGISKMKWFLSFGTLLYAIRDKRLGETFSEDIDISIVGPHNFDQVNSAMVNGGFIKKKSIINDETGQTLYAEYISPNVIHVDLFFWINENNHWWHTYDYLNEKTDIPSHYHFKAVPEWMFHGEPYKYEWVFEDTFVNIPRLYGTLLDLWYPNWFIPDKEFGVSKASITCEPLTCKNLGVDLAPNYK
jgi:hypothetical protein